MTTRTTVYLLLGGLCLALTALAVVLFTGFTLTGKCRTCCADSTQTQELTTNKTDTMIRLNVFIKTTEANRDELIRTGRELVAASLQDEGCIAYDLFESTTRPDVLMICETWSSEESLAAHAKAPHYTALVPRLRKLGEMKLERFNF